MAYKYTKKSPEERKKEIDELIENLKTGVDNYLNSDNYKNLLEHYSKFHDYSLRNTMLILNQCPSATYVASYATWKTEFNRQVNAGEKGLKIICPVKKSCEIEKEKLDQNGKRILDSNGNVVVEKKKIDYLRFKIGYTFDISQTSQINGKPVIELSAAKELTGDLSNFGEMMMALRDTTGADITYESIKGGAKGYYSPSEHRIAIQMGMSDVQTLKTGIHEVTHSLLDSLPREKERKEKGIEYSREDSETCAESVAYIVCKHFKLETSDYSFPYVSGWAGDSDRIDRNLKQIEQTSNYIISAIEKNIETYHMGINQRETEKCGIESNTHSAYELARRIDEFVREVDPFGYKDSESYAGSNFDDLFRCLKKGQTAGLKDHLIELNFDEKMSDIANKLVSDIDRYESSYINEEKTEMSYKRGLKI